MRGDKLIYNGVPHRADDLAAFPNLINPKTLSEKKTDSALVFGGSLSDHHELSNFFKCSAKYKGKTFNCVEQCYQWSKATFFRDYKNTRAFIGTKDPSTQVFLSKHFSGFVKQIWQAKRDDLMEELINCKFSQNPHFA